MINLTPMKLCISIGGLLLLLACNRTAPGASNTPPQPEQTSQLSKGQLPADFLSFYDKFHSDSLFQIDHIAWPLQGVTTEQIDSAQSRKKTVYWEKKNWRMHRPVDFQSGEYKQRWEMLGDLLIIERISYAAANYGLERRFARRDDGAWEMIFYADMQEIGGRSGR